MILTVFPKYFLFIFLLVLTFTAFNVSYTYDIYFRKIICNNLTDLCVAKYYSFLPRGNVERFADFVIKIPHTGDKASLDRCG